MQHHHTPTTGANKLVPVLIPLPCLLVPFYRHCENGAFHCAVTIHPPIHAS